MCSERAARCVSARLYCCRTHLQPWLQPLCVRNRPQAPPAPAAAKAAAAKDVANVAVLGASGYTGAEVVRLSALHPNIRITALTGDRQAGKVRDVTAVGRVVGVGLHHTKHRRSHQHRQQQQQQTCTGFSQCWPTRPALIPCLPCRPRTPMHACVSVSCCRPSRTCSPTW